MKTSTQHKLRERADRSKNLVGFRVGDVRYAVEIARVAEIINPLSVIELPHAPNVVVGVAHHRGTVVPIVDLRRRFGLQPKETTRRTKWIITRGDQRLVGLVVDAVTDVFGAGVAEEREVPDLGGGEDVRGITAVYAHEGELVFVIDVNRVAAPAQALDLSAVQSMMGQGQSEEAS
jgi:purine-binding chemotaxis protein CheW